MKAQTKTVKAYSVKLSPQIYTKLDTLFCRYGAYRNVLLKQYSGIKRMSDISHWYGPRDKARAEVRRIINARKEVASWQNGQGDKPSKTVMTLSKEKTTLEQYGFQGRHMTQAIEQTCMNLKTMWTNLGIALKKMVSNHKALSDEKRAYLYYVFSSVPIWQMILLCHEKDIDGKNSQYPVLKSALTDAQLKHCNMYIRRITRKHKPSPSVKENRSMLYDTSMYRIITKQGISYISLMSQDKGKPIVLKLTSPYCYKKTGTITLVLNRQKKRLEIHKMIKAKTKVSSGKAAIGLDKGLATLISLSNGHEYGKGFSTLIHQEAERVNKRNRHRNPYSQLKKTLNEQISAADLKLKRSLSSTSKKRIICHKKSCERKLTRLKMHHLGHKRYDIEHHRRKAHIAHVVSTTVRQMYQAENLTVLVKEDLSFSQGKTSHVKNKALAKQQRALSSWTKGTLNDRIEYLADYYRVTAIDVNPAYTSQFCPVCGRPFATRTGRHHEIAICPKCGKMDANIAAAKNILSRKDDDEITLYTPYRQVKTILKKRAAI